MTQVRKITLQPTLHAGVRTRNRIRLNGPTFYDETPLSNPKPGFMLFKSTRTSWRGWLAIGEFREQ
jgi:hypothetical protein